MPQNAQILGNFKFSWKFPFSRVHAPGNSLLGTIFSFEHYCAKRYYDDDGPPKWSILRQVSADFQLDTFFPRLISGLEHLLGGGRVSPQIPRKWISDNAKSRVRGRDKVMRRGSFSWPRAPNKWDSINLQAHLLGRDRFPKLCFFFTKRFEFEENLLDQGGFGGLFNLL